MAVTTMAKAINAGLRAYLARHGHAHVSGSVGALELNRN